MKNFTLSLLLGFASLIVSAQNADYKTKQDEIFKSVENQDVLSTMKKLSHALVNYSWNEMYTMITVGHYDSEILPYYEEAYYDDKLGPVGKRDTAKVNMYYLKSLLYLGTHERGDLSAYEDFKGLFDLDDLNTISELYFVEVKNITMEESEEVYAYDSIFIVITKSGGKYMGRGRILKNNLKLFPQVG